MKDLAGFWRDFVDTTDTNDEVNFGLGGDVEVARCACCPLQPDLLLFLCAILLHVRLGPLEDNLAFCVCRLCEVLG